MTKRNRELISSCCLSLGCYSSQEIQKLTGSRLGERRTDDNASQEAIFTDAILSLPSIWPQNGGLTINVDFKGKRKYLPVSPPFVASNIFSKTEGSCSDFYYRLLETAWLTFQNLYSSGKTP
jgi:hypothetical protein